ncbi:MAG: tetratricopeptide repeat protein [bacterium]
MITSPAHSRRRLAAAAVLISVVALTLAAGGGCAYFNTLYNAKRLYKEADEIPRDKNGEITRVAKEKYEQSIEKCQQLITNYPKSKYVDDAIFLIGKCYYEIGQYDDAILKFSELEENFPDSKLNEEAKLYAAKSYLGKKNDERAVQILLEMAEKKGVNKLSDEVLFLLGTSLMKIDREDEAVGYLEALAKKYPKSPRRVDADLEIADIYASREEYEKSIAIYEGLSDLRLPEGERIRYLESYSGVLVEMGDYRKALEILGELRSYVLGPTDAAPAEILTGRAYAGLDSINAAIDVFKTVTSSFPRSMYSAEAHFRLGEIYQEKLDSLQVAQTQYDQVGQQYANSPYAGEALKQSVSISKYLKLQESMASGGEAGNAAVQFDLAEIQLFQFSNYEKALAGYRKVLDDFPDSDLAPKAAYAIAYIYENRLKDPAKAREAYQLLVSRYPDSQQAEQARDLLAGLNEQAQQ